MQEKINEILEAAKGWMTAGEIADKGGWRSASHVGLALKQMKDIESRRSPTKKMSNGMPATEYKLSYKDFDGDSTAKATNEAAPVVRKSRTTEMPTDKECCNAAKVVATTAGAEVATLRAEIARHEASNNAMESSLKAMEDDIRRQVRRAEDAERNRDDLKSLLAMSEQANKGWLVLANEYECKSIPDLRVFIEAQSARIEELKAVIGHAKIQNDALNEQLMRGEEAIDVKDAAKGYLVCAPKRKPMKLSKPESALAKATAAAKTTGRCEVFALVPVGVAVRKQVKAVEFKKAKAA